MAGPDVVERCLGQMATQPFELICKTDPQVASSARIGLQHFSLPSCASRSLEVGRFLDRHE